MCKEVISAEVVNGSVACTSELAICWKERHRTYHSITCIQ